jgi:large subunit ribosomal protein L4
MKLDVYDIKGKKIEAIELEKSVFDVVPNLDALKQYIRVFQLNQRQGTSSVKTRAEVSGSGRKPWKQKGTGRARVGSSRTPLWRHGGIVHGPKPRSWALSLPAKIKRLALISALSKKFSEDKILVLDSVDIKTPKTTEMIEIMNALKVKPYKVLVVLPEDSQNIRKSAQNIKGVSTALAHNLNTHEVLLANKVIFLKPALLNIQEKYKK